MKQIAAERWYW